MARTKSVFRVDLVAISCLLAVSIALPLRAESGLGANGAEQLVRETWYEGLPLDRAAQIDAAGAARLVSMLEDPDERAHHANILMALGVCVQPSAYEAIAAWAAQPRAGEVDRATFRAWQTLPQALGRLARHDGRALTLLAAQLDAGPLAWHFRHHRGERLADLTRRAAATGLAISGLPEADALLERAEAFSTGALREHLRESRSLHRGVVQVGQ
ncbi:MAG: hypothetical protein VCE43_17390 [Myxococcota bacterium]